ncbi:Pectinesterase, catalytic [Corchorus olitorius]|uniref:Pectinesterase, catalytic n=1 Tax=Corchorus olitorius TaxID=93759 RepID=A0A1R3J609_9ROSI|nr:Pectinesterase, catalytic [Corchorus olitorius]
MSQLSTTVFSSATKTPFMQMGNPVQIFPQQPSGYVFKNCSFIISLEFNLRKEHGIALLGRAWGNYSTVIIMESRLDFIFDPKGWDRWDKPTVDLLTYVEFSNRGPRSNTSARVTCSKVCLTQQVQTHLEFSNQRPWSNISARVTWSKVLPNSSSARQYTMTEFIGGDD